MPSAQDLIAAALADIDSRPATPVETPESTLPPSGAAIVDWSLTATSRYISSLPEDASLRQQRDAAILERDAAVQAAEAAYARIAEIEQSEKNLVEALAIAIKAIDLSLQSNTNDVKLQISVLNQLRVRNDNH